ncbi:WYL domain-containing protein [Desertihabitans brevis]|uniref:WYL domain-containing protein n=1 Tax=Desertihabitans brevis TaxID=2268447 RepID=A0A367YXH3_9ACTN|nr:WYL domain-containing protein [Desertihabitans brevis]RCK70219.1 WYL domain-containing protein [Desertihabitans brevis]
MPTSSSAQTSGRLLTLLSLLQARRDWSGPALSERLGVSDRTLRRDVDRLRELGYPVRALMGPAGGYRLDAGSQLPPLLLDDEQAVAVAVALRAAVGTGAEVAEGAARALTTLRQVLPARLRQRVDALDFTAVVPGDRAGAAVDPGVVLAITAAIRAREELRFDYEPGTDAAPEGRASSGPPPRRVQPHHVVVRAGRWYLVGWSAEREDWRVYRVDRIRPRTPNGPRFTPRELPGGDVGAFLDARFRGAADGSTGWPCRGTVVLHRPASEVGPFVGEGTVEPLGAERCRVALGSWSWAGLAATLARFDADVDVLGPPELRQAFADLAARAARAARAAGG